MVKKEQKKKKEYNKKRVYYSIPNLSSKPPESRTRNKNGRIRKKRSDAKKK